MKTTTKPKAAHTPGAMRLAEILIPEGIDSKGRPSLLATAYGKKTREGIADLIDNETSAPALLEALIEPLPLEYLSDGTPAREWMPLVECLENLAGVSGEPWAIAHAARIRAAIAQATGQS